MVWQEAPFLQLAGSPLFSGVRKPPFRCLLGTSCFLVEYAEYLRYNS